MRRIDRPCRPPPGVTRGDVRRIDRPSRPPPGVTRGDARTIDRLSTSPPGGRASHAAAAAAERGRHHAAGTVH